MKPATKKKIAIAGSVVFLLVCFALLWEYSPLAEHAKPEKLAAIFERFSKNPWAPLMTTGIFILAGICFFPLTVLTIATAMTFGPMQGIFISVIGALSSAAVMYGAGYFLGQKRLRKWLGPVCEYLQKQLNDSGILGVTAIRLVVLMPYTMVNMAFGIMSVSFFTFMAGTFLALMPGAVIRSILGDALVDFLKNPDPENMTYIAVGLAGWIGIVVASHFLARKLRDKGKKTTEKNASARKEGGGTLRRFMSQMTHGKRRLRKTG